MEIVYSRHALQRMRRRRISRDEVELTIQAPQVRHPGEGENVFVLRRNVSGRFIKVVIEERKNTFVITTAVAGEEG